MIGRWVDSPQQFWRLRPFELLWMIEAHRPRPKYAKGLIDENEAADIYEEAYGDVNHV